MEAEVQDLEYYHRLMSSSIRRQDWPKVVVIFEKMKTLDDIKPDQKTYSFVIQAYLNGADIEAAEKMYEECKTLGTPSALISNVFLQHYASKKDIEGVHDVWLTMEEDGVSPDELSYVLTLKTLYHLNDLKGFYRKYEEMRSQKPDLIGSMTYNLLSLTLAHNKETDKLSALLREISSRYGTKSSFAQDVEIIQSFLIKSAFEGDYSGVTKLFNSLTEYQLTPSMQHCVATLMGFLGANKYALGERFLQDFVLNQLIRNRKAPSVNMRTLYRILLAECIETKDIDMANRTIDSLINFNLKDSPMEFETNCMVRIHLERNEEDMAYKYVEMYLKSLPRETPFKVPLDTATLFIQHFIEHNEPLKGLKFWKTYAHQIEESPAKLRLALETYAAVGDSTNARKIFDDLVASHVQPTPEICQAVMRAYINNSDSKRAISMFEETQENGIAPDVGSYNIICSIYASRGDFNKLNSVIEEMTKDNVQPNAETYSHLTQAYLNVKKWDQVVATFETHFSLESTADGKFQPPLPAYTAALTAAQYLRDQTRISNYWNSLRQSGTVLQMDHYLPALQAASTQPACISSMIEHLSNTLASRRKFGISMEQAKQLTKILRATVVSQTSPHWAPMEAYQQPGRAQLTDAQKKEWAALLKNIWQDTLAKA